MSTTKKPTFQEIILRLQDYWNKQGCALRLAGSPRDVLEVVRLVTDGTSNACSILYAAAARAGRAMGYRRIQTYILGTEPGVSLRAAGWSDEGLAGGGQWKHADGRPRRTDQPTETDQPQEEETTHG